MMFERLELPDVVVVKPTKHQDSRGFFSEVFRTDEASKGGMLLPFVQDNHVLSTQKGVLRGLHFQSPPRSQGKLVRCMRGAILDVAVDIRTGSPTYGRHVAVELSEENWLQLWVPPGFAHGYVTLADVCEVIYKVTDYYAPTNDHGIAWDDPALGIDWRLPTSEIVLSDKDRRQKTLAETPCYFRFER
jgi:dTDP-4-dehydrorhamnose 3,5-epimerase